MIIYILNKNRNIQRVRIKRKNLNNYIKTGIKIKNRIVWLNKKTKQEKITITTDKYKRQTGTTKQLNKNYAQYRFKQNNKLEYESDVDKIVNKSKEQYNIIKDKNPQFTTQRIMIGFMSSDKRKRIVHIIKKMKHWKTGKEFTKIIKKNEIIIDYISSETYIRNTYIKNTYIRDEETTELMFNDLKEMLLKMLRGEKQGSPELLMEEDIILVCKEFIVRFQER